MTVEVRPATRDEAHIVASMMSLYLCEASPHTGHQIGDDGAYHYRDLAAYWREPGRYPFLITEGAALAGFALVMDRALLDPGEKGHVIAEFFVLPSCRRRGIGQAAAAALFQRFSGAWWIAEPSWNTAARAFWLSAVRRYTGGAFEEIQWEWEGEKGVAQSFTTPAPQRQATSS